MWLYKPEKNCYQFCGLPNRYYCLKCEHVHYMRSKKGQEHMEYGKFPNFPFIGNVIIDNTKAIKEGKLQPIEGDE